MSGTAPPAGPPPGANQTMPLTINIQYVKDLSFEVPGAPAIYTQPQGQPQVNLNLDVQARRLDPVQHVYEVVLYEEPPLPPCSCSCGVRLVAQITLPAMRSAPHRRGIVMP